MADYIPQVDGKVHPEVAQALRIAFQNLYSLRDKVNSVASTPHQAASTKQEIVKLQQQMQTIPGSSFFQNGDSSSLKATGSGQASILPTGTNAISFTNTGDTITWSWSGLVLLWPNQEKDVIPDGGLAVSGLALSTAYNFYPYVDMLTLSVKFAGVSGGIGSPAVAYTAASAATAVANQSAYGDNRVPLSLGGIQASTSGGGSGPGGTAGGRQGWSKVAFNEL